MAAQRVVVVGGGFAGLEVVKALKEAPVEVVLIDKNNHHLFQPLLYQVATAGLSPANIAWPIRSVFRRQKNVSVLWAEVEAVDLSRGIIRHSAGETGFDHLVMATGMVNGWFGNPGWSEHAIGLKDLEDAMGIRNRMLSAFERAEATSDLGERERLMTVVVIGGGPTGVEMAGSVAELTDRVLVEDFRRIDPTTVRIVLVEAGDRLLPSFDLSLSAAAEESLRKLGVEVRTGERVLAIRAGEVETTAGVLRAETIVWGAGVEGSPVAEWLGVEAGRGKRVAVDGYCRVPGMQNVYVVGDVALFTQDGKALPGVATVAQQQGAFVGRRIGDLARGGEGGGPFEYKDPGSMATVGRKMAVAEVGSLKMSGFLAWCAWLFVHLIKLISGKNRILVLIQWMWSYLTYERGARVITDVVRK